MRNVAYRTVRIEAGQAVSGAFDLAGTRIAAVIMPASWTAANLSFQASTDEAGTYIDCYSSEGDELTAVVAASRVVCDFTGIEGLGWVRFRSGTTGSPVNQAAARILTLILMDA